MWSRFHGRSSLWAMSACVMALALAGCGRAAAVGTGSGRPATVASSPTTGPALTPTPCVYAQQWQPPAGNVQLDAVAMDAPGDGWSVGAITATPGSGGASDAPAGVIYHLSGGQWTHLPQTYSGADLSAISMDSPIDGWAVSGPALTAQPDRALVLHYSGGQWRPVDVSALDAVLKGPPGESGTDIMLITVQMFGPDAGWIFAWSNIERGAYPNLANVILRYEHGVWTRVPLPPLPTSATLFSLSAVSANEAWLVATDYGADAQTTRFAHYANGAWSVSPQTFPGVTQHVAMLSASNGWAFDDGGRDPGLLRYNGYSWAPISLPAAWLARNIALFGAIYAPTPGATWLIGGDAAGNALIAQYDNGQWNQVAWPYPDLLPVSLAADGSGDLWGVGDIGHQRGCAPALVTSIAQGVFFHMAAGSWSKQVLI